MCSNIFLKEILKSNKRPSVILSKDRPLCNFISKNFNTSHKIICTESYLVSYGENLDHSDNILFHFIFFF